MAKNDSNKQERGEYIKLVLGENQNSSKIGGRHDG